MVKIFIRCQQSGIKNGSRSGNPQIIFTHISGGIIEWVIFQFVLAKRINFRIAIDDCSNFNINIQKLCEVSV